ncbi:hypothetical protein O2W14_13705 [Modestobacter sp. VKM Ac-2986]|uniref:hypothetical protein n=1 Tax=Modestobacter sp. VKM Ac-2986 TaxID=3004140 RepID=UPI0022ABA1AA|nr:hypothetical protein [Modestobacter sp. VKM Ac-2986]MCZ2829892.1 hypothetical protein [Modestobacter sp. VKM Ac-2986]
MPTSYARALAVAVLALGAGGVALATPAAAMEDPRRPTATVTHGPSCGPGVVRTLVTNGTQPHRVALVFDGSAEQDSAVLAAGQQVELVSAPIAWGVTVDVSVAVSAGDGTPEAPVELETYTRPSAEDCAAVAAPPSSTAPPATATRPGPATSVESGTTPPTTGGPGSPEAAVPAIPVPGTSQPADPATPAPGTTSGSTPGPTGGTPTGSPDADTPPRTSSPGAPSGSAGRSSVPAASSSAAAVSPGGVVTVRATGFTAGEPVAVTIPGVNEPLTTVAAAADGSVETVVQIPRGAALGSTTVRFTGGDSAATAGLALDVAARDRAVPESTGSPVAVAAGLALVGAAGTLGLLGARRSRGRHADTDR